MSKPLEFIAPDWPAPPNVRAVVTTRTGGFSQGPYASFNLAHHVGDDPVAVARNRALLYAHLALPAEPLWLEQVHGTEVVDAARAAPGTKADGAYTDRPGIVLAVLTADCLPVFLCDRAGRRLALLHAGWRGLVAGVIEAGVRALGRPGSEILAWLGPAIGPRAFQVGEDVRRAFLAQDSGASVAFVPEGAGRWRADLYALARRRLEALGVRIIGGGGYCTFAEPERFYSYRRDGVCGRMASLAWLVP
jgi:YfiH family protein